jgi:hypothetical protein
LDDNKYYPFFEHCIGALDGTHVPIHVPAAEAPRYRCRKGFLSQNVLAACDFDMRFTYILAGWEGSAHDGRVIQDAIARGGFRTPKGKYWLGDAGYGCSEFILSPYRGVRYHLKEHRAQGNTPQNAKELFNLRHAALRNVIERIFGVTKRKFKILGKAGEYSIETQIHLVIALTGLANFLTLYKEITKEDIDAVDQELQEARNGDPYAQNATEPVMEDFIERGEMAKMRDEIAEIMWDDYCRYKRALEEESP